MSGPLAILLPLRPFGLGKTRLAERFDAASRAGIAHGLALRALGAASSAFPAAEIFVVGTNDLRGFAERCGASFLPEIEPCPGLAGAVDAALDQLEARGFERALVVMGDLPDVEAEGLRELDLLEVDVAFAESASGHGTNAMMLRLPRAFDTAFGDPHSAELHASRAHAATCRTLRIRIPSLARDVDHPSDVHAGEAEAWIHAARSGR